MTTRMLIDARHREETRVAVVKGNRIEEFDFESAERKQLKGNIYLAKVIRVEPSLQAAFVDYGGNRHGFLAFSEIHPDYYQIPKEDREALLREEAEHAAEEAALRAAEDDDDDRDANDRGVTERGDELDAPERDEESDDAPAAGDMDGDEEAEGDEAAPGGNGGDDVDALRQRRQSLRRRYKIQDVIRRRQVLLVQVVKEERGNKGAALTTYLSLAGRYCVLMPNTSHGGGISRKISNAADRKRLKSIMADLDLPPSMGCIVRTAGLQRTRSEIKRDFDYLARLWDGIRDKTLDSAAPALIYGDSDLIKRAIRDIYNREIEEIVVEGTDGYSQAREFMRLLMPSHARRIKHYSDPVPLFQRAHVEDQLAAMYHPVVQLKSGGYLVINPTEALVSIDINSGRSTREHNIEQTATQTNLEAAAEIARQLRLRDMAGLVVIDFIDMDNGSNVRKVERAMKDALKNDRARIQVGRISSFGLMEMSRQRLRTGVLEASSRGCPHCEGTGLIRTASSSGVSALRLLEDEAARGRGSLLTLRASAEAAVYVLNRKRADIAEIEERYGVMVEVLPDGEGDGARMSVEASGPPPAHPPRFDAPIQEPDDDLPDEVEDEFDDEPEADVEEQPEREVREPRGEGRGEGRAEGRADRTEDRGDDRGKRRRRRRRRGGRRDEEGTAEGEAEAGTEDELPLGDEPVEGEQIDGEQIDGELAEGEQEASDAVGAEDVVADEPTAEPDGERRRRRGRRGRRRGGRGEGAEASAEATGDDTGTDEPELPVTDAAAEPPASDDQPAELPVEAPVESEPDLPLVDAADAGASVSALAIAEVDAEAPKPKRRPRARARAAEEVAPEAAPAEAQPAAVPAEAPAEDAKPKRTRRKAAAEPVATDAPAEDAKPKRTRRRKTDAEAPAAVDTGSADTESADAVEAAPPAGGTAEAPVVADTEPADQVDAVPADASADEAQADADGGTGAATPRRGWWQRTFGA